MGVNRAYVTSEIKLGYLWHRAQKTAQVWKVFFPHALINRGISHRETSHSIPSIYF